MSILYTAGVPLTDFDVLVIEEDMFEQEQDNWDLLAVQPPLIGMPPLKDVHAWPRDWLNICFWLYECSPMIPQPVWTTPDIEYMPRGDGLPDFITFEKWLDPGKHTKYGMHLHDMRHDIPREWDEVHVLAHTRNECTLHLQWPGCESDDLVLPDRTCFERWWLANVVADWVWRAYERMAASDMHREWHPVRVPWTRLRLLGLAKIADGHWQPVLYLSTDYSEYPAPEYEALRAKMHEELQHVAATDRQCYNLASDLATLRIEAPAASDGASPRHADRSD